LETNRTNNHKSILAITGANGFVGKNLSFFLNNTNLFEINPINLRKNWTIKDDTYAMIHLAGIAHDLKKANNPELYYDINYKLTKDVFDKFLNSKAIIFIYISSIKAITDFSDTPLCEDAFANPMSDYGKSKLLSENYILSKLDGLINKKVYILRPTMIYGPGNKGNLTLLYSFVSKKLPWPLASFNNQRSFCYINNLCYVINEILKSNFQSGVYNVCDDEIISTNELVNIMALANKRKPILIFVPKYIVIILGKIGDLFSNTFNSDRLNKLTENFIVSNLKLRSQLKSNMPFKAHEALLETFLFFKNESKSD
jgi:nucleoside-diphosphate-sugar epimerase